MGTRVVVLPDRPLQHRYSYRGKYTSIEELHSSVKHTLVLFWLIKIFLKTPTLCHLKLSTYKRTMLQRYSSLYTIAVLYYIRAFVS